MNGNEMAEKIETKVDIKPLFYSAKLIDGIFLLTLFISAGYITEILNCRFQKLALSNIYMKHLLSFLILYFLNSSFIVGDKHPTTKLINSVVLYIAFIIIMRQNNIITLILFVLIFVIHLINEYENYYSDIYDKLSNTEDVIEKEEMRDEIERYKKLIINLRNILKIITIITITIAIVGLIVNYHMTRMKGGSFSSLKFILGDVKCASE